MDSFINRVNSQRSIALFEIRFLNIMYGKYLKFKTIPVIFPQSLAIRDNDTNRFYHL